MLHFIFDLDYTLYQNDNITGEFSYNDIKENTYLNTLLDQITYNKIIFTNATFQHAIKCLDIMKIRHHFPDNKIVARDTINDFKPSESSFIKCMKHQGIGHDPLTLVLKKNTKVIFFEDTKQNLIQSKNHNWVTIYIGKEDVLDEPTINRSFPTIEKSLEFIIEKNKNIINHLRYQKDHN